MERAHALIAVYRFYRYCPTHHDLGFRSPTSRSNQLYWAPYKHWSAQARATMVGSNTVVPVIADRIATQRSLRYSKSHESGHGNVADSTYTHALAHDALTVPEDNSKEIRGARGGAWCSCLKRRHVSLFWPEKLWLFVCYGQVFGLWWTIARAWPLPAYFRDATR